MGFASVEVQIRKSHGDSHLALTGRVGTIISNTFRVLACIWLAGLPPDITKVAAPAYRPPVGLRCR